MKDSYQRRDISRVMTDEKTTRQLLTKGMYSDEHNRAHNGEKLSTLQTRYNFVKESHTITYLLWVSF